MQVPGTPFDGARVFDADTINGLGFLPSSVVITGSGIIAIEYAKIMRKFGAKVTMLVRGSAMSALRRIGLDETISERLLGALAEDDIEVRENTQVNEFLEVPSDADGCEIGGGSCEPLRISLVDADGKDAGIIESDIYMAATGRRPRAAGTSLNLEGVGVTLTKRGHVEVDSTGRSSIPTIYAAGDVVEGPSLASTGVDQAQRAVQNMFGASNDAVDESSDEFPIGMWTIPEIGYYGMTKTKALEAGYDAEEGMASYDACLRGRVFAPDGVLKLVFDKEDMRILGVHIIGTDACELVHYGMDLVESKSTIFDVIGTLFTAVTFHELFKEAALDGNSKLEFGIQWQEVLQTLARGMPDAVTLTEDNLRERFNEIDVSGDGSLDEEELMELFDSIGEPVSEDVIANLVHLADDDGNGTLEWPEFARIFQVLRDMVAKGKVQVG